MISFNIVVNCITNVWILKGVRYKHNAFGCPIHYTSIMIPEYTRAAGEGLGWPSVIRLRITLV